MRKIKKKFKKPLRPWDRTRIKEEGRLIQKYGLRRKKEIWKVESILRNYRRRGRIISAKNDNEGEKILLDKLFKMGILEKRNVDIGAVLDLEVNNILDRRLQTIVFEKGLANTPLQARQLITHGHIAIGGKKTQFPSLIVTPEMESKVDYYGDFKIGGTKGKKTESKPPEKEGEAKEKPEPKEQKKEDNKAQKQEESKEQKTEEKKSKEELKEKGE